LTRPFLITVDTEGDNIWDRPRQIQTENAKFLPRFQALCEKFNLKPTYLTNYEMAISPIFIEFAKDIIQRNTGEVGMHLHAWNSPPLEPLTVDDFQHQPYLIEYPESVIQEKIAFMTDLLQETFGVKMTSHRAGRWAFNDLYAQALVEKGYLVDCSVTPHVDWSNNKGGLVGGTDFRGFPSKPYFFNEQLLELPVTIVPLRRHFWKKPTLHWVRPNGRNLKSMLKVLKQDLPYAMFVIHSSELMPGGSPTFKTEASIEKLYDDLTGLLEQCFKGQTLMEYYSSVTSSSSSSICST
jgi:hypothetical protein